MCVCVWTCPGCIPASHMATVGIDSSALITFRYKQPKTENGWMNGTNQPNPLSPRNLQPGVVEFALPETQPYSLTGVSVKAQAAFGPGLKRNG